MAWASSLDAKTSRRCRATSASIHAGVRRRRPVGGEHDGLEAVQVREGARSGLLGEQEGGASTGVSDADRLFQPELVYRGEHVGPKARPVEVLLRTDPGLTVAPQVEAEARDLGAEAACERSEDTAVKPGRVDQERRRPVAAELVDGEAHAVGRGYCLCGHRPGRLPALVVTRCPAAWHRAITGK